MRALLLALTLLFLLGPEAYLRDLPDAELHLIDAGHFAVEENAGLIAEHVLRFMTARGR